MAVRAVYPGTFDPVTNGHLDITRRAATLFDDLVVAVYDAPIGKNLMFSTSERVTLFRRVLDDDGLHHVTVRPYSGLTTRFAREIGAGVIVRGIRAFGDFVYEADMVTMNHKLEPTVDMMFLMTRLEYSFISASRVKEVAALGADIHEFVPPPVLEAITARLTARA